MCEQASWERKCCSLLCSKLWELWDVANPVPTAAAFAAPGKVSARDISITGGRERDAETVHRCQHHHPAAPAPPLRASSFPQAGLGWVSLLNSEILLTEALNHTIS